MKTCKKLLAVLLSLMMIASVVIIPASAEDTATADNYVSLLDFSGIRAGIFSEGDATAFPAGIADQGVVRATYNGIGVSGSNGTKYSGKQEIVKLEDGSKGWKINYNVQTSGNADMHAHKNIFVVKFAVPSEYVPYIQGVKAEIVNGATGRLITRLGVKGSSGYGKSARYHDYEGVGTVEGTDVTIEHALSELNKQTDAWGHFNGNTTYSGTWATGDDITELYLYMTDASGVEGGTGYAIIKDIAVNLTIPVEDIPVTQEVSLWDLSDKALGELDSYPLNTSEFIADNRYAQYDGTKEVVENAEGKKVLKLDLNSASFKTACSPSDRIVEGNFEPVYSIKVNVPTDYVQYVQSIKIKFNKQSAMHIAYNFGLTDGTNYSKRNDNGVTMGTAVTGEQVISYTPAQLAKVNAYSAGSWSSYANATKWDNSFTDLFLWLSAIVPEGTEDAGYITIEDISITLTAAQSVIDAFPISKEYSIFDLSDSYVGATSTGDSSALPEGVTNGGIARWNCGNGVSSYHTGTQEVVDVNGKKALKVYFDVAGKQNGDLYGSTGVYAIKVAIPAAYAPYVSGIKANVTAATVGNLAYRFGVVGSSTYGPTHNGISTVATGNTKDIAKSVSDLKSYGGWAAFNNGSSSTYWVDNGVTMTHLYLILNDTQAVDGGTGYAIINDITVTLSASASEYSNMAISKKVSLWDLSANELGTPTDAIKYPDGVTQSSYTGATQIVNGTYVNQKALRLDLANTTFANDNSANDGRINENYYSPVYKVQLNIIPSTYIPYIDSITLKVNKQSESNVRYSFGYTDGTNYSKFGEGANFTFGATTTGYKAVTYAPSDLYICGNWQAGAYSDPRTSGTKWSDDWAAIYLWVTADVGATGYIDIEDISYTLTASAAELAEADAKYETVKGFVTGFENSMGTATEFAISGEKAYVYSNTGWTQSKGISLNTNVFLAEAKGFSFWIYNDGDADTSLRMNFSTNGNNYVVGFTAPAKTRKKFYVDFNKVSRRTSGDNWWGNTTSASLTAEDIAAITSVSFADTSKKGNSLYFDDFYLFFEERVASTTSDVAISADNVAGATITEDGKIMIPASASTQTVTVTIPEGTLVNTSAINTVFTSNASTAASLWLYTNVTLDNGDTGYVKRGSKNACMSIAAGTADAPVATTATMNYYGSGESGKVFKFSGSYYLGQDRWYGGATNAPTASEKCTITTLYYKIEAFGTPAEEGAEVTEYITLDAINLFEEGVVISSATTGNGTGTVAIEDTKVFTGEEAAFVVTPAAGSYAKSVTVVGSDGNTVAISNGNAENLGSYYVFTAPAANVTITAEFAVIDGTMPYEYGYNGEDLDFNFTIPFVNNLVYNESTMSFQNLGDFGVIVTSAEALAKYGYTSDDLTAEFVAELKESGHHLGDYIYAVDSSNVVYSANSPEFADFTINIDDVSANARRNSTLVMVNYADFTDEGAGSVVNVVEDIVDYVVYGDMLQTEFSATNGINYQADFEADLSVWEDIAAQGFDHIRLPLKLSDSIDENNTLIEEDMVVIDTAIENALKAGFSVVVDLHSLGSLSANYAGTVNKYYDVWNQLAERYARLPESVAFQIVNEPTTDYDPTETDDEGNIKYPDPMTNAELMEMQEKIVKNIRAVEGNENRYVVIGTDNNGGWNLGTFTESILALENIIVDIHYYSPMKFTHSGSENWDNIAGNGYEAGYDDYSEADFEGAMSKYAEFAATHGVTVWVGEWGCYQPDYTAKVAYYAEFAAAADKYGVPWSLWEYGGGFSPYNKTTGVWDQELMDAMFSFDGVNDSATETA